MHPNFYHWHSRVQLKPSTDILEPRWNAAVKFTKKLTAADTRSLLRLILFSGAEPEFAKRFTEGLVKAEPTFPPENNAELLRVMAAAAVYNQIENSSNIADALALGLQAANFPQGHLEPVCQDVMKHAAQYLVTESENVRPNIDAGDLAESEKQVESHFIALKKAADSGVPQDIGKAAESAGRGVFTALKESHMRLGKVIGRLTEENQFLWWLIGRRSSALDVRREKLTANAYALPAATEAAERVAVLPPAPSMESLIDEVLAQCGKSETSGGSLADIISATDTVWAKRALVLTAVTELTPVTEILAASLQSGKIDAGLLKKHGISAKTKFSATDVAQQYFREQVFIQAIAVLG